MIVNLNLKGNVFKREIPFGAISNTADSAWYARIPSLLPKTKCNEL